ncbi:MAG: hypothetical protein ACR2JY_22890 [Chloroflexota bacterium]
MKPPRTSLHGYEPKAVVYVACYALFAVLLFLCYVLFLIWQRTVTQILVRTVQDKYGTTTLLELFIVLLGLILFVVVIASEHYLRVGVERRKLLPRFATVAGSLIGIIALGLALQELLIVLP